MERLPCQPEMVNQCRVFLAEGACREDIHHEYWPKSEYTTEVQKKFRELEVNKIFICRALHNAIHAANHASDKPNRSTMVEALDDPKNNRRGKVV